MNVFKFNGGFTLVELIVVIAILAILAGVAVPAYAGYIEKANDAAVIMELNAVSTAAQAAYAEEGAVTQIVIGTDNSITVTPSFDLTDDFDDYYGSTTFTGALKGSYAGGATWTNGSGWAANK